MITRARFLEMLATYFSASELDSMLFDLGGDAELLPPGGKMERARNMFLYLQRRGQIADLIEIVKRERPNLALDSGNLSRELFEPDDVQREGVARLHNPLRETYEELQEWKELHNYLHEILNVFDQFGSPVDRKAEKRGPITEDDIASLKRSWEPVQRNVSALLMWAAQDIKHIGERYEVLEDGNMRGELWAIKIAEHRDGINGSLRETPNILTDASTGVLQRLVNGISKGNGLWPGWWRSLHENTRGFDNAIRDYLFFADKELRRTAAELHDLSRDVYWS